MPQVRRRVEVVLVVGVADRGAANDGKDEADCTDDTEYAQSPWDKGLLVDRVLGSNYVLCLASVA